MKKPTSVEQDIRYRADFLVWRAGGKVEVERIFDPARESRIKAVVEEWNKSLDDDEVLHQIMPNVLVRALDALAAGEVKYD